MQITIESPDGPRAGALPVGGIHDERTLIKALLVTLAVECVKGYESLIVRIPLDEIAPDVLIAIARAVGSLPEGICDATQ